MRAQKLMPENLRPKSARNAESGCDSDVRTPDFTAKEGGAEIARPDNAAPD